MKMEKITCAQKNAVEDIVISNAQYRVIVEIAGYELSKAIEVALFKSEEKGRYCAIHWLASYYGNAEGKEIRGIGKTEDEACRDLSSLLVTKFNGLEKMSKEGGDLTLGERNQLRYLRSIMQPTQKGKESSE